ncbi:MAG: hypothetical protein RL139_158 [Gemmatimonadota bacterium]
MRSRRPADRRRAGIALPAMILLLTIFIGMAALAVDISRMFVLHGQLRNAAEAGALAGVTRLLHEDGANAVDSALAYAQANPVGGDTPVVTPGDVRFGRWDGAFTPTDGWSDPRTNAVQVEARHDGAYVFGRFFGIDRKLLQAGAVASIVWTTRARCIRPLAIPYATLLQVLYPAAPPSVAYSLTTADITRLRSMTQADAIPLKLGTSDGLTPPGNFYPVRLPPARYADGTTGQPTGGGDAYRYALSASCDALTQSVGAGDWLAAESGNMSGPTRAGVSEACGVTGASSFVCDPAVPYLLPIWDVADKSVASPTAFHVKYLGVFFVTSYDQKEGIRGYFSSLSIRGQLDTIPGPLTSAALRP